MSDDLRIRRFEPGDAERVRELHEAAMRDADAYLGPENLPDGRELDADLRAVDSSYLARAGSDFLVGEVDGEVVATGAFQRVENWPHADAESDADGPGGDVTIEITRMRVAPEWQGNGFGRRLLTELEARAVEWGADVFVLDTLARLSAARGLYEQHGYRETGRETRGEWERLFYRKRVE